MKIKKKYKDCLRSFSCIIDYKRMENDKIETLLVKKNSDKMNKPKEIIHN